MADHGGNHRHIHLHIEEAHDRAAGGSSETITHTGSVGGNHTSAAGTTEGHTGQDVHHGD